VVETEDTEVAEVVAEAEEEEEEDHPSQIEDPTIHHHPPNDSVCVQPSKTMSSALERKGLPTK